MTQEEEEDEETFLQEILPRMFKHQQWDIRPSRGSSAEFESVGRGSFGVVFEGLAHKSGQAPERVAIKAIRKKFTKNHTRDHVHKELDKEMGHCMDIMDLHAIHTPATDRIMNCMKTMAYTNYNADVLGADDLDVPSIPNFFAPGKWAYAIHVLDCAGENGKDLINRKWGQKSPVAATKMLFAARQILQALDHIHNNGRVVMDLKFENVCATDVLNYPFVKVIDLEEMAVNNNSESKGAADSHIATLAYLDRFPLMVQQERDDESVSYTFFCGLDPEEYGEYEMPPNVNTRATMCPFGHAQDVWSMGMSLLRNMCGVEHFPKKAGHSKESLFADWERMKRKIPSEDPPVMHFHDRFPTSVGAFREWIRGAYMKQGNVNHCANMTDGQLDTLFRMLHPFPWKRKRPSELLQMELFNMSTMRDDRDLGNPGMASVSKILDSGNIHFRQFQGYAEHMEKQKIQYQLSNMKFEATSVWLDSDRKGLVLKWKTSSQNQARFLHLSYVGRSIVNPMNRRQVHIQVNRMNTTGCDSKLDKSCKFPDNNSGRQTAELRKGPHVLHFDSERLAENFAAALQALAHVQKNVTKFDAAYSDGQLPPMQEVRGAKPKKKVHNYAAAPQAAPRPVYEAPAAAPKAQAPIGNNGKRDAKKKSKQQIKQKKAARARKQANRIG